MRVRDLTCDLMNPVFYDPDQGIYLGVIDQEVYGDWFILQISADADKNGQFFVLIDISKQEYSTDLED